MSRLTARQAEAIRESLLIGIVPRWVHGHTLRALLRKGLIRLTLGDHFLTDEGRVARGELRAKEGC